MYIKHIQPQEYLAGQIADSNPYSTHTTTNTDVVKIPYGIAMKLDPATEGWKLPASATDVTDNPLFVSLIGLKVQPYSYDSTLEVVINDPISIPVDRYGAGLSSGSVAVQVEEAVSEGDPVFVRFLANGTFTQLGAFRKSADNNSTPAPTCAQKVGWVYVKGAAAGGYAVIQVK